MSVIHCSLFLLLFPLKAYSENVSGVNTSEKYISKDLKYFNLCCDMEVILAQGQCFSSHKKSDVFNQLKMSSFSRYGVVLWCFLSMLAAYTAHKTT